MSVRTGTVVVLVAFAASLAYFVGNRLSTQAIDIAVGVLCGMGASLPVSVGLLVALTRQRERTIEDEPTADNYPATQNRPARPASPQIIVVAPPQAQYGFGQNGYGYGYPGAASYDGYAGQQQEQVIDGRDWRIIGDDEG